MEKILIVYESRYGATRQYAQAIGRALGCPVYSRKELPAGQLESCSILDVYKRQAGCRRRRSDGSRGHGCRR